MARHVHAPHPRSASARVAMAHIHTNPTQCTYVYMCTCTCTPCQVEASETRVWPTECTAPFRRIPDCASGRGMPTRPDECHLRRCPRPPARHSRRGGGRGAPIPMRLGLRRTGAWRGEQAGPSPWCALPQDIVLNFCNVLNNCDTAVLNESARFEDKALWSHQLPPRSSHHRGV